MNKVNLDTYIEGQGCMCNAYGESECACNADWTPREVYTLRARVKELEDALGAIYQINTGNVQDLYVDDLIEDVLNYEFRRLT